MCTLGSFTFICLTTGMMNQSSGHYLSWLSGQESKGQRSMAHSGGGNNCLGWHSHSSLRISMTDH